MYNKYTTHDITFLSHVKCLPNTFQHNRGRYTETHDHINRSVSLQQNTQLIKKNKQMFVKHLPPARSEYRVPQRPITKTGTKEGQLTQRYY